MRAIILGSCLWIGLSAAGCAASAPAEAPAGDTPPTTSPEPTPVPTTSGVRISLHGQFRTAIVGRRNADGSISSDCADDAAGATALVRGATPRLGGPAASATRPEVQ